MVFDIGIIAFLSIQEMDAGWIGRVAVGNEDDLLTGSGGPDRLVHGNDRGLRSPVISNMVGGDFQVL